MLRKTLFISLTALFSLACSSTQSVDLMPLIESDHCPIAQSGLTVYPDNHALQRAFSQAQAGLKQTLDLSGAKPQKKITLGPQHWAFSVHLGQRPSSGYGISLEKPAAKLKAGILSIELKQQKPTQGSMQAAVITSPCIIIEVDGDLQEMEVREVVVKSNVERWHSLLQPLQ